MVWVLWGEAIARLSHVFSLLRVKPHADGRTHEGDFVTTAASTEATTATASELLRAMMRRRS